MMSQHSVGDFLRLICCALSDEMESTRTRTDIEEVQRIRQIRIVASSKAQPHDTYRTHEFIFGTVHSGFESLSIVIFMQLLLQSVFYSLDVNTFSNI